MPEMKITGLAQETDFADPEKTNVILVIDRGALRLRIDETSVRDLLDYALQGYDGGEVKEAEKLDVQANGHALTSDEPEDQDNTESDDDEEEDEEEQTDETGISQI
jgi:hypothetical protein